MKYLIMKKFFILIVVLIIAGIVVKLIDSPAEPTVEPNIDDTVAIMEDW